MRLLHNSQLGGEKNAGTPRLLIYIHIIGPKEKEMVGKGEQ